MEKVYLDCFARQEVGKNKINALRKQGFVPAVVYGGLEESIPIKLNRSLLIKFIHAHHGVENMIITLRIDDDSNKKSKPHEIAVLIKEIQYHPVSDEILHIDFNHVSLTKALQIKVPIAIKGEAEGVKKEGGVLTQVLWELDVKCLPVNIPEKIEFDVSSMKIGDSIQVKNLVLPEGITLISDPEAIVLTLRAPRKEEPVAEAVAEAAAPTEPEVIKKEKKVEEAEEPEAKAEKPEQKPS